VPSPSREPLRRFLGGLRSAGQEVLDLLLPARCQLCDAPAHGLHDQILCEGCANAWPLIEAGCRCCGRPGVDAGASCPGCLQSPPPFDRARALALYEGKVIDAVQALKYQGRRGLAPLLGKWMAEALPGLLEATRYQYIVPVPMHWQRRIWRGYNQAELLAQAIGRRLNIPVELEMRRLRAAPRQVRLGLKERQDNTAGLFAVSAAAKRRLSGARVLMIDDVFTTGATTGACSFTLKAAGVAGVDVFTLARTP